MRSPFPGMDPYLEDPDIWMDFHERFITYCSDALNERLPDAYEARIEERISLVEAPEGEVRWVRADVAVSDVGAAKNPPASNGGAAAALLAVKPVTVPLIIYDELHESKVHILDRRHRRLVTVLELLSPTNKSGSGLQQYLSKRNSLLRTSVHLIEIDLLIEGQRLPHGQPLPTGDYYVYSSHGDRRPNCDVFAWSIRQPIPPVPVPLRAPDPDLPLDLQELFQTTYERGRYRRSLQYSQQLVLPLAQDDLQWSLDIVRAGS